MASLGNDIGANDTTVFIPGGLSIYSYPAQFAVDSEDVLVTGGTSPTYSVSRGQNGTAKATHSSGTTVVAGWASDVDTTPTLAQVVAQGSAANAAITSVTDPTGAQDAATKHYVDNSPTLKSR